ncbi:hypothetical protein ACF0H5_009252 [Mactra antiquata]
MELSEIQSKSMETEGSANNNTGSVNKVTGAKPKTKKDGTKLTCYRCGSEKHFAKDPSCPAKNKKCHKCSNVGHFQKCCRTKSSSKQSKTNRNKKGQIRNVQNEENESSEEDQYVFNVQTDKLLKYEILIGGIPVKVIIDSGSTVNIIDKETWEHLKNNKVSCYSNQLSDKKLFPYGCKEPLNLSGEFEADISLNDKKQILKRVTFYVIKGKAPNLLSRETAVELGVLKIGSVHAINEDIVNEYKDCFQGLGTLKDYKLKLHIDPKVTPVAQKMYAIPLSLRQKVSDELDKLESLDVIEKVEGPTPWVSPVVVVNKPSGQIRLCVDMRQANKAILRERHIIPTIDDVLPDMNNSCVFSKIDLNMGFHQIMLQEESRYITTFITHKGLYRYKRLNFGINAAPEMFQHIIHQTLLSCKGVANIADDIIIHGSDQEHHDRNLKKCLETLKEKGLTINRNKSQFNMDKVVFMGHVISGKGIGPTEERVKDLVNAKEPKNAAEVRSFLGLVNFSARYIPDIATVTEPLRKLTRKNQTFNWGREQQNAFQELKRRMANVETLGFFKSGEKTTLVTDASNVGLGAVLIQNDKVISYASRSLSDIEKRYSTTEKEALAIVWACEKYNTYLYGTNFELITDHKPLEIIYSTRSKPSARIQRWVLRLLPYTFTVKYRAGRANIADYMSRSPGTSKVESVESDEYIRFVAGNATPSAISTREVERASASDEEMNKLHNSIQVDKWENSPNYIPVRYELSTIGHLVLRGTRIVVPKCLRKKCIELAHEGHLGVVGTKQNLRTKVWWPKLDQDVENYLKSCYGCQLVSQLPRPEPMIPTELPAGPWQDLAIDLLGPLPSEHMILVCIDYYSRYYEIDIMKTVTSEKIIESLDKMFLTHGLPLSITSDNGRQFVSQTFESYLKQNNIEHRRTTPLHPSANGEVERQNRSLLKRLKIAQAENKDWKKEIQKYLVAYRTTPHSTTGVPPSQLLFNRKIRTKLPDIQCSLNDEDIRDKDMYSKQKNKTYIDNKRYAKDRSLEIGDKVLLKQERKDKLTTTYEHEPYKIIDKVGNQVTVKSAAGVSRVRNSSHVKKFYDRNDNENQNQNKSVDI